MPVPLPHSSNGRLRAFLHFATILMLVGRMNCISFNLDENITDMCFVLRGENTGKNLHLKYEIVGLNPENVRFSLKDLNANEILKQLDASPVDGKVDIALSVNYKHNFMICWKNMDSEMKSISFYYLQGSQQPVIDKGTLNRRRGLSSQTHPGLSQSADRSQRGH